MATLASSPISSTPPVSPGVGARRRGPKSLPTLPLSAFSPPNTGISDSFPVPQSPTTVHPERVVDASVRCSIPEWKEQTIGSSLAGRVSGIIVKVKEGEDLEGLESQASQAGVQVLAVSIPFSLESGIGPVLPSIDYPVTLTASFDGPSDEAVAALKAALTAGHTVEIDVQGAGEENWERLEDVLTKATYRVDTGLIILSNVLPPSHDLDIPIVKLLTHPSYQSYQSHVATLSFFPRVYLSYIPPTWNAATPPSPQGAPVSSKEKKEWKRRIKMYVGPAVEAFGFERIVFGSAPSPASHARSNAGDWYEIAREAFAELGVDQESVDAVFGGNAQRIYAAPSERA